MHHSFHINIKQQDNDSYKKCFMSTKSAH